MIHLMQLYIYSKYEIIIEIITYGNTSLERQQLIVNIRLIS